MHATLTDGHRYVPVLREAGRLCTLDEVRVGHGEYCGYGR